MKGWMYMPAGRYRAVYTVLMVLSAAAVVIAVCLLVQYGIQTGQRQATIAHHPVALGNADVPSSARPSLQEVDSYRVAPLEPKLIRIPKLSVKARVTGVGVASQKIQAPANIHDAGWYSSSSLPGSPGVMFIDGHVSSWTDNGIFYRLHELRPGDALQIVRGDDKLFTYKIDRLQEYDAAALRMDTLLSSHDAAVSRLVVVTCSGKIVSGTDQFDKRLVVYATLTKP